MIDISVSGSKARAKAARKAAPKRIGEELTPSEFAAHRAKQHAEKVADRQEIGEKAKAAGMKKVQLRAPDGSVQEVWGWQSSFLAMRFEDQQIAAAERFQRDWESAYRGLRGQSLEPVVDGGGVKHGAHLAAVEAQSRLDQCKKSLGERSYSIVVAIAINGGSARLLHANGAKQHVSVSADIEVAFNHLYGFYFGSQRKDPTWRATEKFNAERAALIEKAEREVG